MDAIWENIDHLTQTMEFILQLRNGGARERVDTVPRGTVNTLVALVQVTNGSGENNETMESEPVDQGQEATENDNKTIDRIKE